MELNGQSSKQSSAKLPFCLPNPGKFAEVEGAEREGVTYKKVLGQRRGDSRAPPEWTIFPSVDGRGRPSLTLTILPLSCTLEGSSQFLPSLDPIRELLGAHLWSGCGSQRGVGTHLAGLYPSPCPLSLCFGPFSLSPHHHLLGQGGWGSLSSCCSCWSLEGAPPTGHPANVGRGCSWHPALRPAERGPRQRKGRPGGGRTCITTESLASPPLPAPPPGTLVRNVTFRTLWVETQPLPRLCSEAAPPSQVAWPSASLAGM
ncbi:uncharacterized protein [Macaca nemestrina]|uniref:uncharacterized protein n=1 Tax=Macaca nemestrina TaxID=9545 RepID=UPI0039B8C564